MPLEPLSPTVFAFIAEVNRAYASLDRFGTNLGGQLLYTGELDALGCALACAGNIAGAATLAASADQTGGKQAMRNGFVDFLVNSLDEALRILKNQVRKRETVAVCVTAAPEAIERDMDERGVLPDLTASSTPFTTRLPGRTHEIQFMEADPADVWLTWRPIEAPALYLPKLDALALECLPPDAAALRRWLERAPRSLGRLMRNTRVLRTTQQQADQVVARIRDQVIGRGIATPVEIGFGSWGSSSHQFLVLRP